MICLNHFLHNRFATVIVMSSSSSSPCPKLWFANMSWFFLWYLGCAGWCQCHNFESFKIHSADPSCVVWNTLLVRLTLTMLTYKSASHTDDVRNVSDRRTMTSESEHDDILAFNSLCTLVQLALPVTSWYQTLLMAAYCFWNWRTRLLRSSQTSDWQSSSRTSSLAASTPLDSRTCQSDPQTDDNPTHASQRDFPTRMTGSVQSIYLRWHMFNLFHDPLVGVFLINCFEKFSNSCRHIRFLIIEARWLSTLAHRTCQENKSRDDREGSRKAILDHFDHVS